MTKIKKYIAEKINVVNRKIFYADRRILSKEKSYKNDCSYDDFEAYREFVSQNSEVKYSAETVSIPDGEKAKFKWTGAQFRNGYIYAIPNSASTFLRYHVSTEKAEYVGSVGNEEFKWTGGTVYSDNLYAFPRKAKGMLRYSFSDDSIIMFDAKEKYMGEHHYGGVCNGNGIVYQPPRNTDHILVWDLNRQESRIIRLAADWRKLRLDYSASLIHPNGFIYFFPTNGRIIKMNLDTEEWQFIGERMKSGIFEAKIACNGDIYGFGSENGILKISVMNDTVEMMHTGRFIGAYGTKLGINGKLYSIPGKGRYVWEYSPLENELAILYDTKASSLAKYAGGVTMYNGNIIGIPENEKQVLVLQSGSESVAIPDEIYQKFWIDCY